jgi:hypothetical protein
MLPWYSYVAFTLFIAVVLSPAWAFKKIDKLLDRSEEMTSAEIYTHPYSEVLYVGAPSVLEREEKVLENLQHMIDTAQSDITRRIWENKHMDFMKQIRWRKLEEGAHGKSRVYLRG